MISASGQGPAVTSNVCCLFGSDAGPNAFAATRNKIIRAILGPHRRSL